MIHLDTSFLIQALKPGSPEDRKLRIWIEEGETLVMSTAFVRFPERRGVVTNDMIDRLREKAED